MALVDPYSPCPCGSGQKFKWCCHKVEATAERAQRLYEGGQLESAVQALDDGLRKEPGNAWLLTRKALYLTRAGQTEPAKEAVRVVLQGNPRHVGARMLLTRLALETEGAAAGVAQLQQALEATPRESRGAFAPLVKVVGAFLSEAAEVPAALRHLRLSQAMVASGEPDQATANAVRMLEGNPAIPPWQKNPDALSPAPETLSGEARTRFDDALDRASEGLWASAASAFERLSSDPVAGPLADRNLGFCRLWLAEDAAAVVALRRYAARLGPTAEAVDIEALCQQMTPPSDEHAVEHVRLTWPVRDREALLSALRADPTVHEVGPEPDDPENPDGPESDLFGLLDRPRVEKASDDLKRDDVPRVEARLSVGKDTVALEAYDDGRLDRLADRFTRLARAGIPPAHPKTKVIGKSPRSQVALTFEWLFPEGTDPAVARRINDEQNAALLNDLWPETPDPTFGNRTPLQAAKAGDAEVPLRAALFQFELEREVWRDEFAFNALRSRLNVPPEPALDPETVDIDTLNLARLTLVPADRLSDEKLVAMYRVARRIALNPAVRASAEALIARPEAMERLGVEGLSLYTDLAALAAAQGRDDEAFEWVRRGRAADTPSRRPRNAPAWDIFEIRLRARAEAPETWVPELAAVLDRYRDDEQATQTLMMNLIDMGLLEMVPNPDHRGEVMIDSRPLMALMAEYGPRVTTSTGRLGVSATKPEIWTPSGPTSGGAGGGGGGLWTPGGGSPQEGTPGPEKKLILPGR